jgi:hypothetical protein
MITADKLTLLTSMPAAMLEMALPAKGRPQLQTAKFLGITNGHQFCYSVTDTAGQVSKVFLTYNPAADQVIANIG